jgi:hypothetical protein
MAEPIPDLSPPEKKDVTGPPVEHRFKPGQSGNPGGRPRGLARKVREVLGDDDGEALARFWAAIMSGYVVNIDPETGARSHVKVEMADRISVSKLLAERGWGKPPAYAPIEDDDPLGTTIREEAEIAASFDARLDEVAERRKRREAAVAAAE